MSRSALEGLYAQDTFSDYTLIVAASWHDNDPFEASISIHHLIHILTRVRFNWPLPFSLYSLHRSGTDGQGTTVRLPQQRARRSLLQLLYAPLAEELAR
jgi:hypothetical protein